MFGFIPQKIELTSQHQQMLRDTTIDETGPGTILRDFAAFLDYFKERPRPLTGKHQIKLKDLEPLNARLTRPLKHGLERPQQKSFPHINGLYLLLRASGLTYVNHAGKTPGLVLDAEFYAGWEALNPTERYFMLLETWVLRGLPQILGERGRGWGRVPDVMEKWLRLFLQIPEAGLEIDTAQAQNFRYYTELHNLGLMDLFGLITVQPAPPQPGEPWMAARIARTLWGDALLRLLYTGFFSDLANIRALEDSSTTSYGALQPVLQPYFPAWQTVLAPSETGFREDRHVFKVVLWQDVWWRIALPGTSVMHDLAYAILAAVDFDSDHLYQFSYQNRLGAEEYVNHPYMDEGPWADEVRVGDLPLHIGQTMDYLFDFGDSWHFAVTLESVEPSDAEMREPMILEAHGEPPEQYPSWDDEEDW